jgi:two-component system heavy metal sensor histidine kinase CusS
LKIYKILRSKITSSFARWSVATQLAWSFSLSAFVLLVFASGFQFWALITTLQQEDENFLNDRVRVLENILREQPENTDAIDREIAEENTGFVGSQYLIYSRILDESGLTLHESNGMKEEIPPSAFPSPQELPAEAKNWRSATNKNYLLIATWAGSEVSTEPARRIIQVASDETGELLLVDQYERYLIYVLLAGILVSALIGILVAQRAMKPLTYIVGAASRVTVNQLHTHIDTASWPRELALLGRAFDDMLDRLEGSFNRLSQFSANLAHELRTPLNNLRGEAEVALSKSRNTNEYREILASSLEEYDRLSRMMDGLLFLAKTDSSQAMVVCSVIDVRREVEKIIDFYEALAAEGDVRVICTGDGAISADPVLFRRVVSNLLSNAPRYTPAGGKITFSIRYVDGGVEVICCDSGEGIGREHLPKIFDRFYRAHPSQGGKAEGAGLGLAIVKSIVGLHGGDIKIQSALGEGTSIQLLFPAVLAKSA